MIQLTKKGLTLSTVAEPLERRFGRQHVFRIRELLSPELLETILPRLARAEWLTRDDGTIAREAVPSDSVTVTLLNFALNTPEFLALMRQITGCRDIKSFVGRVYRMAPDAGHFDSWHSDIQDNHGRRVGMSINLSHATYAGGTFHLRDEASGRTLCELPNTGLGDAIFFRIAPTLTHMVSPLEGVEPKTAFAGWFCSSETDVCAQFLRGSFVSREI